MSQQFNSEMLILARESRGLTQQECAIKCQISQGEQSKIETGIKDPSDDLILKFSSVLRYAPLFFGLGEQIRVRVVTVPTTGKA